MVAHELGHWKLGHTMRTFALGQVRVLCILFLLSLFFYSRPIRSYYLYFFTPGRSAPPGLTMRTFALGKCAFYVPHYFPRFYCVFLFPTGPPRRGTRGLSPAAVRFLSGGDADIAAAHL